MSVDARKGMIAAALAALVGVGCWWLLRSETDGGTRDAHALAEKPTTDAATPDVRAPRHRETPETDAPAKEESAAPEPPAKPETLTIHVLSADDDAPIAGAVVHVDEGSGDARRESVVKGDDAGVARIEAAHGIEALTLSVVAPGFLRDYCQLPDGEHGADVEVSLRLHPATALEGVAVDGKTGAPLAGVKVVAEKGGEAEMHCFGPPDLPYDEVVTGADGVFRLDGIPPVGPTSVTATSADGATAQDEWDGVLSRHIELRLHARVVLPGAIRGVVRDVAGAPVSGMRVSAKPSDDLYGSDDARTRDDGSFEIADLQLDRAYDVWADDVYATPPVASAVTHDVVLTAAVPTALKDLSLVRSAELALHVRDRNGRPIEDARVDLETTMALWNPKLDAAGDAVVVLARPGRYHLAVVSPAFVPHEEDVEIAADVKRSLTVVLDRGAELSGVVVDDLGAPAADVLVEADPEVEGPHRSQSARTSDNGTFHVTGCVAATSYRLTVSDRSTTSLDAVAPKDDLRMTATRNGAVVFKPRGVSNTFVRLSFASSDGTRSFTTSAAWEDDAMEPVEVAPGTYDVVLSVAGLAPVPRRVVVAPGATVDLGEIVFDRGVALSGRVVDRDGHPVTGARVEALVGGARTDHVAWTDASGAFRVFRLPAGELKIAVAAECFVATNVQRKTDSGAAPFVVTILRGGVLKVRVADPARRHDPDDLAVDVAGPVVDGATLPKPECLDSGDDGVFVKRLAPGRWRIRVLGEDDAVLATKDVEIRDEADTSVELVLDK